MIEIRKIEDNKKDYLELLLLADPSEEMVDKYLAKGDMFLLFDNGKPMSEAVFLPLSGKGIELKNLATAERLQKKGYASALLFHCFDIYKNNFETVYVGTSDFGVSFYEKLGFTVSHVDKGFFIKNYKEAVYDGGFRCEDMIYLKRSLVL